MSSSSDMVVRQYAEGVVKLFAQAENVGWDSDAQDELRENLAEQWYDLDDHGRWVAEQLPKDLYWIEGQGGSTGATMGAPDDDELSLALRNQDGASLRQAARALEDQLGRDLTAYLVGRAWTFLCGHAVGLPFLRAVVSGPESHDDFYLSYFIALVNSGALEEARAEVGKLSEKTSPDRRLIMLAFKALDSAASGCSQSVTEADAAELEAAIAAMRPRVRFPGTVFRACRALSLLFRRMGMVDASRKWAIEARRAIPDSLSSLARPGSSSSAANDATAEDLRSVFSEESTRAGDFAVAA